MSYWWSSTIGALVSCLCAQASAADLVSPRAQYQLLEIEGSLVRWKSGQGIPLVVRYAIASRRLVSPAAINCRDVQPPVTLEHNSGIDDALFRQALAQAFARWEQIAAISFVWVSNQEDADIVIGEQATPQGRAFTNVFLAEPDATPYRPISRALICLNPQLPWKIGFNGDLKVFDIVHTMTHEIGHALGLDHPSARGPLMAFHYDERHEGLGEGDVRGAVQLYGPRERSDADAVVASLPAPAQAPR